jgi:hypothetical protein
VNYSCMNFMRCAMFSSVWPSWAYRHARSSLKWTVVFCCIVNCMFSMCMGAGIESIRAVRSSCGVAACMVVGPWWVIGWIALTGGPVCWISAGGACIVRGAWASSISVSLGGPGRLYCVFLVFTVIFAATYRRVEICIIVIISFCLVLLLNLCVDILN